MPHIKCNKCGDKIWGHIDSLPEAGLCTEGTQKKQNIVVAPTKIDIVIDLLSELKREQNLIRNQINNLEQSFEKNLRAAKASFIQNYNPKQKNSKNSSASNTYENYDYCEGDAIAELADEEFTKMHQETKYNQRETSSDQSGADYDSD